jgi:predicted phosphoribosyltransferase
MRFKDRSDAGRQLAKALASYKEQRPMILALPRGGVPVAGEVAAVLIAPLDLILVRKIGVPSQPELAMGAVVDGRTPIIVRNEDVIRHAGSSNQNSTPSATVNWPRSRGGVSVIWAAANSRMSPPTRQL